MYRSFDAALDSAQGVMSLCKYRPGDILWVRETWFKLAAGGYAYKADANANSEKLRVELGYKWHPSIHMPKEAARIFLRVTGVRVEQLRDMGDNDVQCEGFANPGEFIRLWDSTINPTDRDRYGWDTNPWVWVIAFEVLPKDEAKGA